MTTYAITLQHIADMQDEIISNNNQLGAEGTILVQSKDVLKFMAKGANWHLQLILVDGDFDHSSLLIKDGQEALININEAPDKVAIFEVNCDSCSPNFTEAPKRIIVSSVRIPPSAEISSAINKRIERLKAIINW